MAGPSRCHGPLGALKFLSGAPRVGVSARLAKQAVADAFGKTSTRSRNSGTGFHLPIRSSLPGWSERGAPPLSGGPVFRPLMLAHPLEEGTGAMQLRGVRRRMEVGRHPRPGRPKGGVRGFSRAPATISARAFPNSSITSARRRARRRTAGGARRRSGALQRSAAAAEPQDRHPRMLANYPAMCASTMRSRSVARTCAGCPSPHGAGARGLASRASARPTAICRILTFDSKEALNASWAATREEGIEGLMLKRRDSPYLSGRPKGHWYKWKRAALTADCVLMYAQRGSGKRSSFYSDYTFGAWTGKEASRLVPVGKAYSGFTDEELVAARPLRAPEHDRALRPGPRRSRRSSFSRWPSMRSRPPPATSPASPCAFPASPASAGTSPRRSRHAGEPQGADHKLALGPFGKSSI